MTTKRTLRGFLLREGVLVNFTTNSCNLTIANEYIDPEVRLGRLKEIDLGGAFDWSRAPEGTTFWQELYKKYKEYIRVVCQEERFEETEDGTLEDLILA